MEGYKSFMDRQTLSELGLARLLELEAPRREVKTPWGRYVSLAAGLLAAVGLTAFSLWRGLGLVPTPQPPTLGVVTPPAVSDAPTLDDQTGLGFVAQGPGSEAKLMFPNIHGVDFADVTDQPELAAKIALPGGSFTVELAKEDVLKIFWGPDGKPQVEHPKLDTGDFPLMLMNWAGYTITGSAIYDGNGDLWQLTVQGEKGEDSFTLRAAPGRIPPTCMVESGGVVTKVIDTEVTAWYRSYDREGNGEDEHVCTSELMAHGVGVRFENIGSGGMRAGEDEATDLGGAKLFNAMFVTQMCHTEGGLYLDHIAHRDDVPAWRNEEFETLAQAREEAAFAPYLPKTAPVRGEFSGYLSYQEGRKNHLFVRWSRGYDDIEVEVWLPEGDSTRRFTPVDVSVPESYDYRLCDGPICDAVPKEYQLDFYKPTFRAEDMSPEVIQARGTGKDTGGMAYRFNVLLDNGVVVGYGCSKLTAQEVWAMVEAIL